MVSSKQWWGDFEVAVGQTLRWQIGPTTVWIARAQHEWRIASKTGADPFEDTLRLAESVTEGPGADVEISRFALRSQHNFVRLLPTLADRPVVVKTENPLYIPAGEEATLFVGSPLWLTVHVGSTFTRILDAPILRPSDTWFGPDTLSGELCYASRTSARLHKSNLPYQPHRAVSAARIRNKADTNLLLEKLKVPVENLSLFVTQEGRLVTERLTLERAEDSDTANVRLEKRPSKNETVTLVSAARQKISKGFLLDAFGTLLSRRSEKEQKDERIPREPGASSDTDT